MIRRNFLDAIVGAVTSEQQVPLDFVYGDVSKRRVAGDGKVTLRPLDGQQRLTTLFLLHWYVAFPMDRLRLRHTAQRPALLRTRRRVPAAGGHLKTIRLDPGSGVVLTRVASRSHRSVDACRD